MSEQKENFLSIYCMPSSTILCSDPPKRQCKYCGNTWLKTERFPLCKNSNVIDTDIDKEIEKKHCGGQPGNKNAEKWTEEIAIALGNELIEWLKAKKSNIFYEEFLVIEKNLDDSLIFYLETKFNSFAELKARAKRIQEIKLKKYGVADKLNATMTKFIMINNHDYKSERQDIDHTTKGDKIIVTPPIVVKTKEEEKKEE